MAAWILLAIKIILMILGALSSGKNMSPLLRQRMNRLIFQCRKLEKEAVKRGCEAGGVEGEEWEKEAGEFRL